VIGVAACGVLIAHWLAYAIAIPRAVVRGRILAETGHSYWELAARLAVVLLVVGLGSIVSGHVRRKAGDPRPQAASLLAARLITMQVAAFLAMEVVERLVAGAPLGGLLAGPVLLIGLAAQVLVATVFAILLTFFERGVELLVEVIRARRIPRMRSTQSFPVGRAIARPTLLLAGAAGLRGPPAA
jgi:hypothetical protein